MWPTFIQVNFRTMAGWVPRIGNISAHIRQMRVPAHEIMQDDWNNTGIIARSKQRHRMYDMDLVSLPECPHFEELMTHVNTGRKIMWKLWRTWSGAQEVDKMNEIINWMAAELMHQTKKTDFNSVLSNKWNTSTLECKRLVGYVEDEDDSNGVVVDDDDDDKDGHVDDDEDDEAAGNATEISDTNDKVEENNKRMHSDDGQHDSDDGQHNSCQHDSERNCEMDEFTNTNEAPIVYLTKRGLSPELIAQMGKHKVAQGQGWGRNGQSQGQECQPTHQSEECEEIQQCEDS
jgi:hypothetical protein